MYLSLTAWRRNNRICGNTAQIRTTYLLSDSELELGYAPLMDFCRLRVSIECHFREAQQSWGLEDVMHVIPTGITHAANLSWVMVKVAYKLRTDIRQRAPGDSVLDLKADGRGDK